MNVYSFALEGTNICFKDVVVVVVQIAKQELFVSKMDTHKWVPLMKMSPLANF